MSLLALTVDWMWTFALVEAFVVPLILAFTHIVPRDLPVAALDTWATTLLPPRLKLFFLTTAVAAALDSASANPLGAFTAANAGFTSGRAGLLLGLGSAAGRLIRPLVGLAAAAVAALGVVTALRALTAYRLERALPLRALFAAPARRKPV